MEEPEQRAVVSLHQTQGVPELQRGLQHQLQPRQHHADDTTRQAGGLRSSRLLCEQTTRVLGLQRGAGQGVR